MTFLEFSSLFDDTGRDPSVAMLPQDADDDRIGAFTRHKQLFIRSIVVLPFGAIAIFEFLNSPT
jgi:hypothetical protein